MPVPLRLVLFFGAIFALYFILHRATHKNAPISGPFFFDMDCLVLNTGVPYSIPFSDIDRVELEYRAGELETRITYNLWIRVVRKNGQTKKVWYKGSRSGELPADYQAALEEKGLTVATRVR